MRLLYYIISLLFFIVTFTSFTIDTKAETNEYFTMNGKVVVKSKVENDKLTLNIRYNDLKNELTGFIFEFSPYPNSLLKPTENSLLNKENFNTTNSEFSELSHTTITAEDKFILAIQGLHETPQENDGEIGTLIFDVNPNYKGNTDQLKVTKIRVYQQGDIMAPSVNLISNIEPIIYSLNNEIQQEKDIQTEQPNKQEPVQEKDKIDSVVQIIGNSEETKVENRLFTDTQSHWASKDIEFLASKQLISGTSATTFSPNKEITRAEFTALLVRLLDLQSTDGKNEPFADINTADWYYDVVNTAYNSKLVAGKDAAHFLPNAKISREEMAVMVIRAIEFAEKQGKNIQQPAQKELKFLDNEMISSWAKDGVQKATKYGIVSGRSADTFAPKANASRAESAVMIKRMYTLLQAE